LVTFTKGAVQRTSLAPRAEPRPSRVDVYVVYSATYVGDSVSGPASFEAYIGAQAERLKGNAVIPLTRLTP
jgi:hypothetical protein